ncbi:hypothetical protein M0804_011275 [Polistes exclamans]|nr:hypothetical protein M0804_011275 [Polistes exclamans]
MELAKSRSALKGLYDNNEVQVISYWFSNNKNCKTIKSTIERGTSTDSLSTKRSRKRGMQIHGYNEKEDKSCECKRKRCCERKRNRNKGKRGQYRSSRCKRKRKYTWLINCLRKLCFCVKTPKSYEKSNTYARSNETLLQNCEYCCRTYKKDKRKGTSKKSHHSKNHIFLPDDKTLREDSTKYQRANGFDRKCQCINTIAKNRTMNQHQSYLQGVLSKGFNVMCRGINFCI